MLDNTPNQLTKFRTKNWVEINDESGGTCNTNSQIRFRTSMLRSSLYDYSDEYIFVKGTIKVVNTAAAGAAANNLDKKVMFKKCALLTTCISRINNAQIDDAQFIDVVMTMYNLIEYSDNYSNIVDIVNIVNIIQIFLWQYFRDVPAVNDDDEITDFTEANATTDSFNFKVKLTGQTENNGTKNVEIMVPSKYLSNFWRTLEIPLINCEITLVI